MSEISKAILEQALRNRNYLIPEVMSHLRFWIMDINAKVEISIVDSKNWLKVHNSEGKAFLFIPLDGAESVFGSTPPPVSDPDRFIYNFDDNSRAGGCDTLLIDTEKWHFIEFKTDSYTENLDQINFNRKKAELQIARAITYFREQTDLSDIPIIGLIVTPRHYAYPRFKANKSGVMIFKKKWKATLLELSIPGDEYRIN